ncbi:hypothetical protein OIDMADRAFT_68420, partial [Oidiodendron maius Zn]
VSLFDAFDVETITFKYVQGNAIMLDVMVPKTLCDGEHPVNIRFHGGFLVNGARNMVEITPPRILQHAIDENIIIVAPDYRLLPEGNGKEILEDVEDAWNWVSTELDKAVRSMRNGKAGADIGRIMVSGESAGGYLAIQVALSHPLEISAVIATYPMIDMRDPFYCTDYAKNINNQPQHANEIIDDHLQALPNGPHPSTRGINSGTDTLAYAMIQRGRFLDFFGVDRCFFPIERLEDNAQLASDLSYLWLQHGTADTEVPIDGSRKFVSKLKTLNPRIALR